MSNSKTVLETYLERLGPSRETFERFVKTNGVPLALNSQVCYAQTLSQLHQFAGKPLEEITKDDVANFVDHLARSGRSPSTVEKSKRHLKTFYKRIGEGKLFDRVEWLVLGNVKTMPKSLLTDEDVKAMVRAAQNPRDRALIHVLYESGARAGEVLGTKIDGIKVGHVQFDQYGAVMMVEGKTGPRRIRLIHSAPLLQEWLNQHPSPEDPDSPLWPSAKRGDPLGENGLYALLRRAASRAGIRKKFNPHLFRHSSLTQKAKLFSESELKVIAGWTPGSREAARYIHLSGGDIERKLLAHEGLLEEFAEIPEEDTMKARTCPRRCRGEDRRPIVYPPTARFCTVCGTPLDQRTAMEMERTKGEIEDQIIRVLDDPQIRALIMKKLREQER